jgi:hypothetical protein
MALTETKVIDKIEVLENSTVQVREVTRIIKDGNEIAHTYHRWVFTPGSDVSEMPTNVQAICQVAWTPEVISAYEAQQAANQISQPQ